MFPTEEQKVTIERHIGCARFIYNWGLNKKIKAYETEKKKLSCFDLGAMLPKLKEELPWLTEVHSQTLQMSLQHLDNAFTKFFKKTAKFPNFKSKHNARKSYQHPQGVSINFGNNIVKLPKTGEVTTIFDRTFTGKVKTCTISKTPTNKFFISILVETPEKLPDKLPITEKTTIGIDVGIKHFVTTSDGFKYENPKFLQSASKRLTVLQRRASKKKKASINRKKANYQVAVQHEKITNKRNDFLHKLSHNLVCENQTTMIACEDLNIKGMIKHYNLAKSISDASWGRFIYFLEYKCSWYGRTFQKIGRFDASSKICSNCGSTNHILTLSDREWTCLSCNITHDRDINAAINIKKFGYFRSQGCETESKQSLSERFGTSQEL